MSRRCYGRGEALVGLSHLRSIAAFALVCKKKQVGMLHLTNTIIVFAGSVVKRSHGYKH
jgi:hypothetical protein